MPRHPAYVIDDALAPLMLDSAAAASKVLIALRDAGYVVIHPGSEHAANVVIHPGSEHAANVDPLNVTCCSSYEEYRAKHG